MAYWNNVYQYFKKHTLAILGLLLSLFSLIFRLVTITSNELGGPLIKAIWIIISLLISVVFIGYIIASIREFARKRSKILVYPSVAHIPPKFGIETTLSSLGKVRGSLVISSRTSFSWLCGSEKLFTQATTHTTGDEHTLKTSVGNGDNTYLYRKKILQDLFVKAIKNQSTVHFILMNPNYSSKLIDFSSQAERDRLKTHFDESIKSYFEIRKEIPHHLHSLFRLSITDYAIQNSMLSYRSGVNYHRFHFDISAEFMEGKKKQPKPVIVFLNSEHCEPFEKQMKLYQLDEIDDYVKKSKDSTDNIIKIIEKHNWFSQLRNDSMPLLYSAFSKYHKYGLNPNIYDLPYPKSIHLMVTNKCSTKCKMCKHHRIVSQNRQMSVSELLTLFGTIRKFGTKNIVISGGEPLARPDIFTILENANKEKLEIGLLTNGIKVDNENNLSGLNREEAKMISHLCKWVQVSVDSFNQNTYSIIRGIDGLPLVSETIKNLYDEFSSPDKSIEICYTIQKDNIHEIPEIEKQFASFIDIPIDKCRIRFKFAHGPCYSGNSTVNGDNDFLCNESQIESCLQACSSKSNFNYLSDMIRKGYFRINEIAKGTPIKSKINQYFGLNFKCQILKLTFAIDPFGDIYPCCYLYDDNSNRDTLRTRFKIGSLRDEIFRNVTEDSSKRIMDYWLGHVMDAYRNRTLPVDEEACSYCTRFFYQNEALNKIDEMLHDNRRYLYIDELDSIASTKELSQQSFWL